MKKRMIRLLLGVPLLSWRVAVLALLLFVGAVPLAEGQTLFGSDNTTDQLITINTTTGMGSAVGALGFSNVLGLSFCNFLIIPTLSQWGMIIMAGFLGLIALYAIRRRLVSH